MDKIKASFDSLPVAVCFFDGNGVVRLVNHRMLAVMSFLRKDSIQMLAEMETALAAPPEGVSCLNPKLHIYAFPDGRALRFAREQITTKERKQYTQITATDVTELMQRQARLREESAKLAEANDRLRKLFEQMPEIIREEETLEMKLRVHDDIGHSILTARRALLRQAGMDELRASAALWEQAIAVLYRSNQLREGSDPLETAIFKAREMGVSVLTEGCSLDIQKNRALLALAINECASNCVRHADGTELYVRFSQSQDQETLILTNNGTPPKEEIKEGGGLSMLRRRVEEAGGKMEIQSSPQFALILEIPTDTTKKEVRGHESDDR